MSVRSILAETDVGCNVKRGIELAEEFDGEDDGALGIVCGRTAVILP